VPRLRSPVRKEQNGRELTLQQNIDASGNFNVAELLIKTRLHFTGAYSGFQLWGRKSSGRRSRARGKGHGQEESGVLPLPTD